MDGMLGNGTATFGTALRMLFQATGAKHQNLAAAVGYDSSYVSRWINGSKVPSLRNNAALCARIAAFFVHDATPDARRALARTVHAADAADAAGDPDELLERVSSFLASAHAASLGRGDAPSGSGLNARYRIDGPIDVDGRVRAAASACAQTGTPLEIISTSPVHGRFWGSADFFHNLRDGARPPVLIDQFVRIEDIARNPRDSMRSLVYLMSSPYDVEYRFYRLDAQPQGSTLFAVRGSFLLLKVQDPFSLHAARILTEDPAIVQRYWANAIAWRGGQRPFAQRGNRDAVNDLLDGNDFEEGEVSCVLRRLPATFLTTICGTGDAQNGGDADMRMLDRVLSSFERIFIFKPEVAAFVNSTPDRQERTRRLHALEAFADCAEKNPCDIRLLDDQNDVLGTDDLAASVYLCGNRAYVRVDEGGRTYSVSDPDVVGVMAGVLDELAALPRPQCLPKDATLAFIRARIARLS